MLIKQNLILSVFTGFTVLCMSTAAIAGNQIDDVNQNGQLLAQQQPSQQPPPQQPQQPPQPQQAPEVSDEEFEAFMNIVKAAAEIEKEVQEKQEEIFEEHELSEQEFNEMQQAQHNPDVAEEYSEEELENFEQAFNEITSLHQEMQKKIMALLDEYGLNQQDIQRVQMGIQMDPELMQRYQQEMEDN